MHNFIPFRSTRRPLKPAGLTLIELLVAICLLSIVAVLGWRGLDGITRARVTLTDRLEKMRGQQLTFAQMQQDCAQIVSAAILPDRAALIVEPDRITLVRNVFTENQPARLQVVVYRLKDSVLTRRESVATRDLNALNAIWTSMVGNANTGQSVVLQSGVAAMTMRVWFGDGRGWRNDITGTGERAMLRDASGNWHPATGADAAVANTAGPSGLEVALQLQEDQATVTKIFLLGPV